MKISEDERPHWFGTTQWTQVLTACSGRDDATARRALENLCRLYWFPLYGYVRRKGYQQADAEDLTQGFFAQLLEKNRLAAVAPEKGRFRTFLLTCFDNHLRDERDKRTARKRGGEQNILSLDWEDAESRYRLDVPDGTTPEHYFERKWAMEILARALTRVREHYVESGQGELFDRLKPYLTGGATRGQSGEISEALRMNRAAVRVAVSRLRKRYRDTLRAAIRDTVADPLEADAEYEHVCQVLSGGE